MTNERPTAEKEQSGSTVRLFERMGRVFSGLLIPQGENRLFIFVSLDSYGDEASNVANLINAFEDLKPVIILCEKNESNFKEQKEDWKNCKVLDFHSVLNGHIAGFSRSFYKGVIAKWINSAENPIVIGIDTPFFYELVPLLKQESKKLDWLHHNNLFEVSKTATADIDARIVNTKYLKNQLVEFYNKYHFPKSLKENIHFIDDAIVIPKNVTINQHESLRALFIKRNESAERIKNMAESALTVFKKRLPVKVSFVGVASSEIDNKSYPFCTFHKKLEDREALKEVMLKADALLLPGKYVEINHDVMEMMALGKPVITIAEGPILDYIKDEVNGYLIKDYEDPKNIIDDFHIALSILTVDRTTLFELGRQCRNDAIEKFNPALFEKKWKEILNAL